MTKVKKVLTIGEVSKICGVSSKTAQKWFDSKILDGYILPSSKGRRVPVKSLVDFMNHNNIPLEFLEEFQEKKFLGNHPDPDLADLLPNVT